MQIVSWILVTSLIVGSTLGQAMAVKSFPTADNQGLFYLLPKDLEKAEPPADMTKLKKPTSPFVFSDKNRSIADDQEVLIAISGGILPDHQDKRFRERLFEKYSTQTDQIKTNELRKNALGGAMLSLATGATLTRFALLAASISGFSGTYDELVALAKSQIGNLYGVVYHQPFPQFHGGIYHILNLIYPNVGPLLTGSFVAGLGAFILAYVGEQLQASDFDRLTLVEHFTISVEEAPVLTGNPQIDNNNIQGVHDKVMLSAYQKCVEKLIASYPNEQAVKLLVDKGFCNPVFTSAKSLEGLKRKDKTIARFIDERKSGRGSFYQRVKAISPANLVQFILPGFRYKNRLKSRLRFANAKDVSPSIALSEWMGTDPNAFTKYLKTLYAKVEEHNFQSTEDLLDEDKADSPKKRRRPQNRLLKPIFSRRNSNY